MLPSFGFLWRKLTRWSRQWIRETPARHCARDNDKMTPDADLSSIGEGRFERWKKHVTPRVLSCLVAFAVAIRISGAPAEAANVPATPSDATSPLTGAGVGDVAPFSLETSGAGSDYTRAYIPNQPLTPSASPAPAAPPGQSPSLLTLPSP